MTEFACASEGPVCRRLAVECAPLLFVGETLVDLTCEHPVSDWSQASCFTPHCGGAPTNAAVVAARCGALAAIGGGVGHDQWGRWLGSKLTDESVDLRWWTPLPGVQTAVAFVAVDAQAIPDFVIYGEGIEAAMEAFEPRLGDAVASCAGVVLGSNTCLRKREREITERCRALALAQGKPVIIDINLRPRRWDDLTEATDVVRSLCRGAFLVKANEDEARLLTGEDDSAIAAEAICTSLGVRLAVVTLGASGALLRGEATLETPGVSAEVVDTTGAGDAVTGVLAAALAQADFDPQAAARALPVAVGVASKSTEGYGALGAVPRLIKLERESTLGA